MKALVAVAVPVLWLGTADTAAAATPDPHLARYEARTIVTGTDLRSRPAGMAACLADVLVKVSGDPTVADDRRLPALLAQAATYAADFDYRDRMSGISHHDEQGSSDRPYDLTVRFDPARIDAALRALGRAPWSDPRPTLLLRVHVSDAPGTFDLTDAAPRGAGMRAAIRDSAEKYGMPVALPGAGPPADAVPLPGTLTLRQAALGWVVSWHLDWQGRGYDWGVSGVDFDEAFRDGIRGAMQVLSGHGAPQ
jgi:hypothetical protein